MADENVHTAKTSGMKSDNAMPACSPWWPHRFGQCRRSIAKDPASRWRRVRLHQFFARSRFPPGTQHIEGPTPLRDSARTLIGTGRRIRARFRFASIEATHQSIRCEAGRPRPTVRRVLDLGQGLVGKIEAGVVQHRF